MKKIGVWGNFGKEDDSSGQSMKVRSVYNKLIEKYKEQNLVKIDTTNSKNVLKIAFKTLFMIAQCEVVILIPAGNGIKKLAKLVPIFNVFFNRPVIVIPVGSSLPKVAEANGSVRRFLKKIDKIYCQGQEQKDRFNQLGIESVEVMNNFRDSSLIIQNSPKKKITGEIKICVFSRISEDKGIFDAIEGVKLANEITNRFKLEIYGPIYPEVKEKLFDLIDKNNFIQYKGVVPYNNSTKTLSNYHCLIFPTYYVGEGQAGTLVECLFAGTPMIATRWKSNQEIVIEGKTGYLVDIKSPNQIKDKLLKMFENQKEYDNKIIECKNFAIKFTDIEAPKNLLAHIDKLFQTK